MHRRDRRCCTADRRKWSFLLNTTVLTARGVFPKMNSYNRKLKQHCTFAPPLGLATSGLFGPRPVAGPAQGLAKRTLQSYLCFCHKNCLAFATRTREEHLRQLSASSMAGKRLSTCQTNWLLAHDALQYINPKKPKSYHWSTCRSC